MTTLLLCTALFAGATAGSIVLTGDRQFLSGNLRTLSGVLGLVFSWRFIVSMALALSSRAMFVLINRAAFNIPALSASATSVTTLATAISYPVILATNAWLLGERLTMRQLVGATLILVGIVLALGPAAPVPLPRAGQG